MVSNHSGNSIHFYLGKNKNVEDQFVIKLISKDLIGHFIFYETPPQEKFVEIQNMATEYTTFNLSLDPPCCQMSGKFLFNVFYKGRIDIEIVNIILDVSYQQKKIGVLELNNIGTVKSQSLTEFEILVEFSPKNVAKESLVKLVEDYYENGAVTFEFNGNLLVKVLMAHIKYPIQFTQEKKF